VPRAGARGHGQGPTGRGALLGRGVAGVVREFLYDKDGNIVGADQPQAFTTDNVPHFADCNKPQGITFLTFSAIVEHFGRK
jgi:hypothetical protein